MNDQKDQKTVREITHKALNSTVLLIAYDAKNTAIGAGSGFVVHGTQIVSNFHVVENAAKACAKLVGQDTFFNIKGIVAIDRENDLVLLDVLDDFEAPPLELADSETVQVSDPVYAVGNPQGFLEGTVSQGIISGFPELYPGAKHIQMTAPISKGSSGGPVLNDEGAVVGISVGSLGKGQLLNFAIPSNCLETLLTEERPANPLLKAVTTEKLTWEESETYHWISRTDPNHGSSSLPRFSTRTNDIHVDPLWGFRHSYRFTLRNQCLEDIRNIRCYVTFFDAMDTKIYRDDVIFPGTLPAGAAKLINFDVDASVSRSTRYEINIVSFDRVKHSEQDNSNSQNLEGVTWFGRWRWTPSTAFGFSLENRCREDIEDLHCQIIFRDENDKQIRLDEVYSGQICAGMAKLINFDIDPNIQGLTLREEIKLVDPENGQNLAGEGITYENIRWSEYAFYTFSLRNELDKDVKNIRCHIFFFSEKIDSDAVKKHIPIDSDVVNFAGSIPSKMTKEVNGTMDLSIADKTKHMHVKIISFEIIE